MKDNGVLPKAYISKTALAILIFALTAVLSLILSKTGLNAAIAPLYTLGAFAISSFTGGFAFGASYTALAALAFNFIYAGSPFAFAPYDLDTYALFAFMAIATVIAGKTSLKAGVFKAEARENELRASAALDLARALARSQDIRAIAEAAANAVSACFGCPAGFLYIGSGGKPSWQASKGSPPQWGLSGANGLAGLSHKPELDKSGEFYDWPIWGGGKALGLIRTPKETAGISGWKADFMETAAEYSALALDRQLSTEQREKSLGEIAKEKYKGTLLRAISHDLRTPLSGIIGTTEMLLDMERAGDMEYTLTLDINREAKWLQALVENILCLTKIQNGGFALNRQMEAIEEVIGSAVGHIEKRAPGSEIKIKMPEGLILAPIDAKLIEQVLINLLDNAIAHSKPDGEITLSAEVLKEQNALRVAVQDSGPGIGEEDLPNVFKAFFTSGRNGIGLGLAICESIVKAHGGQIEAKNRVGHYGAEFVFTLPLEVNDCGEWQI